MGIVFRQSVKSSIVIFAGALLGALIIYLSTELIPKQEFGFLRYFTSQAVVASQVTMLGMNIVLAIYLHKYAADDPRRPVLITISLVIPILVTVLMSLIYLACKPWIISWYAPVDRAYIDRFFFLLPVYILLWSLLLMLEQYLNSQLKVAISVLMREVVVRLLNIAIIILYALDLINFDLLVVLSVLIYIVPIVLLWFFSAKTGGFSISFNWKIISLKEHREILHFAWYHMLMGISLNLFGYLDTLMLGSLAKDGMKSVAEYQVAVFIMSFLQIPYRAMATAALPDLTRSYEANDMEKVRDFFRRAGINALVAAVGMSLIIVLNMQNAVLVLNKGYDAITIIVIILTLGRLAEMATGLNNEMISISKYYKFNFYISILLVIMIFVFNYLLIPVYGVYGAAWGTTIAVVLFNIFKLVFLWKKMKLQPFSKGSLGVVVAGMCAGAAGYVLPFMMHPIMDAAIRSLVILIVYVSMLVVLKPSADLNHFLASVKKNKRLF